MSGWVVVFAIVRAGNKQYRVAVGDTVAVDRVGASPGSTLELEVLAVGDEESLRIGTPVVSGARVTAEVLGERKGQKIDVLKYKPKVRYQRRSGQRRRLTDVKITTITAD